MFAGRECSEFQMRTKRGTFPSVLTNFPFYFVENRKDVNVIKLCLYRFHLLLSFYFYKHQELQDVSDSWGIEMFSIKNMSFLMFTIIKSQ